MLTVRLSVDMEKRLSRIARLTHRTRSDFVRGVLEAYIEKYERLIAETDLEQQEIPDFRVVDAHLGLGPQSPKRSSRIKSRTKAHTKTA